MENVELFREFLNYKMAGTSCYIFLLVFFSLFWLVHRFCFGNSRLPSNKCYQRGWFTLGQWCTVSYPGSPTWSWFFTVVYSFLDSLLRVSESLPNSFSPWESFIGFHLWGSPFSTSLACLLSVRLEIEFRGKRGVGMRTMGAEMSSRASSYLVYYIVWRVNLSKLSRNKDNNN